MAKLYSLAHIRDIKLRNEILKIGTHFLLCAPILPPNRTYIHKEVKNESHKETTQKNY
jgi:hypothetical protein